MHPVGLYVRLELTPGVAVERAFAVQVGAHAQRRLYVVVALPAAVVALLRQVLALHAVAEPVVLQPADGIQPTLRLNVLTLGAVEARAVAFQRIVGLALRVGVAAQDAEAEVAVAVGGPLQYFAAQLQHVAVGMVHVLAVGHGRCGASALVAHPQGGHAHFAGKGIPVGGLTRAVV